MVKSGVILQKDNLRRVLLGLAMLPTRSVLVGIPSEKTERDPSLGKTKLTNAAIGYIQNYGAPEVGIPARPFMEPGIRAAQAKITAYLKQAGDYALAGDQAGMLRAMDAVGLTAQNSVKRQFTDNSWPALAESTLYRRKHRKIAPRQGERPLIDTGQLRQSITFVVQPSEATPGNLARQVGRAPRPSTERKPLGARPVRSVLKTKARPVSRSEAARTVKRPVR